MANVPGYIITTKEGRVIGHRDSSIDPAKLRKIADILGVTEVPTTEAITKILAGKLRPDEWP